MIGADRCRTDEPHTSALQQRCSDLRFRPYEYRIGIPNRLSRYRLRWKNEHITKRCELCNSVRNLGIGNYAHRGRA